MKNKKGRYEKPYFQTDHTGLTNGFMGMDHASKKKNAKLQCKKKKK